MSHHMGDEGDEKLVGLNSFPKVPEYEPQVDSKQTQWARYGRSEASVMSSEGWHCVKSDQQLAVDNASRDPVPVPKSVARIRAPERVTLRIIDAPGSFALPLKVKKQLKPNFRVGVAIAYRASRGVSFCCRVKSHLIGESERHDLQSWSEPVTDSSDPLLLGTTTISHVFEDAGDSSHSEVAPWSAGGSDQGSGAAGLGGGEDAGAAADGEQLKFMHHEFEFSAIKVTKPSRMRKVYIVFYCNLLERDLLYTVYHVPTIVIAHITNQGARALNTLLGHVEKGGETSADNESPIPTTSRKRQGQPVDFDENYVSNAYLGKTRGASSPVASASHPGYAGVYDGQHRPVGKTDAFNMSSLYRDAGSTLERPGRGMSGLPGGQAPDAWSLSLLRDFVVQEYEAAGLTRPLTEMDMRIIEMQAGFPDSHEAYRSTVQISQERFAAFQAWFMAMIQLLGRIRTIWNKVDPTCITGFDVGRLEAVRALEYQPPGTFLIRLSLSTPGSIVVSIRRDADRQNVGVVHALIEKADLDGRRVETWVRDVDDAKMMLDIYTGQRISKHEVFMPEYVRLADAEQDADPLRYQADGRLPSMPFH